MPVDSWRYIVDDFAVTFSITRHSLLESLVFYLLDDDSEEALKVDGLFLQACYHEIWLSSPFSYVKYVFT